VKARKTVEVKMRVKLAVGERAGVGVGVILLVLKGPVLVAKPERHQKQDRDMCLEVLPDPRLAPQFVAVAIQDLGWKLMHDNKNIWTFMLHDINIIIFAQ
jgi:hypothetical protein